MVCTTQTHIQNSTLNFLANPIETTIKEQLEKNQFVIDFTVPDIYNFNHTLDELVTIFKKTRTLRMLAKEYAVIAGPMSGDKEGKQLYRYWSEREAIKQHIREVYEILGLPPIRE